MRIPRACATRSLTRSWPTIEPVNDAKVYGADTVLLVPGKVDKKNPDNESYEQVWSRSQEEVRKVIPLADQLGVRIAIEVVWNDFITTPEELIRYVDAFQTPTVGAYFDCSNMVKFGVKSGDWIRKLGKRMLKFDFKGYSKTKGWVPIGEGDEDWPDIVKALGEIGYNGWATAEVSGGGEKELRDVAERMDSLSGGLFGTPYGTPMARRELASVAEGSEGESATAT